MVAAVPLLAGCGGGPEFYQVSGEVTFRGVAIPAGEIRFAPDGRRGNEGPAVVARIVDGRYTTPAGKGIVGGPYEIRIAGFGKTVQSSDPTAPDWGAELFPEYVTHAEFGREDAAWSHDIGSAR